MNAPVPRAAATARAEAAPAGVAPLLVFGWGNRSRGDDALGPLFVERLKSRLGARAVGWVDFLEDHQLQVEHALDLAGRARVLFVDAAVDAAEPFEVRTVVAARDASYTSHAMSPQAVLQAYGDVHDDAPPPCTLLLIRGERFGLGEPLGERAGARLDAALAWAETWLGA